MEDENKPGIPETPAAHEQETPPAPPERELSAPPETEPTAESPQESRPVESPAPPRAPEPPRMSPPPGSAPPRATPEPSPFTPPPPRKNNAGWYVLAFLGGCLSWALLGGFLVFVSIAMIAAAIGSGTHGVSTHGDQRVGVIRVSGVITGGRGGGDFLSAGGAGAERIIDQLERARTDDSIKAVVMRVDSPGGSAAASEEIYKEILRVRKDGKPVVTSMGDVAASGGYYVASGTDEIVADAATITGSIGVIMELTNLQGLFGKIGVNPVVIKSGKFKDIGSPNRPMTPEEHQMIQAMINDTYEQFVDAVAEGRKGKLTRDQIKAIADGRIFTGRQAQQVKLIDTIGGMDTAVKIAAKRANISGEPETVELGKTRFWDLLNDTSSEESTNLLARRLLTDRNLQNAIERLSRDRVSP